MNVYMSKSASKIVEHTECPLWICWIQDKGVALSALDRQSRPLAKQHNFRWTPSNNPYLGNMLKNEGKNHTVICSPTVPIICSVYMCYVVLGHLTSLSEHGPLPSNQRGTTKGGYRVWISNNRCRICTCTWTKQLLICLHIMCMCACVWHGTSVPA